MRTFAHLCKRIGVLALFTIAALAAPTAEAQKSSVDTARVAAARELLDLTGSAQNFDVVLPTMMDQITRMLVAQRPDKRTEIEQVGKTGLKELLARRQELIDEIAVIYATRLNDEEIAGLTTFFKSPIGRRYVAQLPTLMKESMAAGQAWGQRIGAEIDASMRRELKKRGIDL